MRRLLPPFAVLVVALAGCGGDQKPAGGPPMGGPMPVPVATVVERELAVERELTGRVEAVDFVELRPRVGGLVEKVLVQDGADVKAGDVLLQIDEAPLRATVARADADVARAESRAALAKLQLDRADQLLQQKVIAPQQHDELAAGARTANADVAAAKAALETARLDLGYAKVTAPIAGRIGKILTTAGNLLQGGGPVPATLLTTIVSVDPVDVVFDLDEETWSRLGDRLRASQAGSAQVPVSVGIAGEDGYPHAGVVRFVDNRIDSASGAIRIRAKVENKDRLLTPGAFARVRLQIAPPKPCVLVNEGAVKTNLSTRFVLVVDGQNIVRVQPIELGGNDASLRVVTSGLKPGDRIAVGGMAMPDKPVLPIPASMETLQPLPPPSEAAKPADAAAALPAPDRAQIDRMLDEVKAQVGKLGPAERLELADRMGRSFGKFLAERRGDVGVFVGGLDAAIAGKPVAADAAVSSMMGSAIGATLIELGIDRDRFIAGVTEGFAAPADAQSEAPPAARKAAASDAAQPAAGANRASGTTAGNQ